MSQAGGRFDQVNLCFPRPRGDEPVTGEPYPYPI